MTKVSMNVKVDRQVRDEFAQIAAELGQTSTGLINGLMRQVIRDRSVTFSAPEVPNGYLRQAIADAHQDFADGSFVDTTTPDALRDHLESSGSCDAPSRPAG
jgi:antitoxin component of RelBE/YafQ-DinJ toxin-antitoxin module